MKRDRGARLRAKRALLMLIEERRAERARLDARSGLQSVKRSH